LLDVPWRRINPVLALHGATPHWMDSTDYLAEAQSNVGA
jgi:hypothetical protein